MPATASITLSLSDAKALSQGSVWSEMGTLHQLEAQLAAAVAKIEASGQSETVTIVIAAK